MIGGIAVVLVLGAIVGVVAAIGAMARRHDDEPEGGLVRRLVVAVLTFGMTIVVASGAFQILDAITGSLTRSVRTNSESFAIGLSLLIVGAPAAYFLWRYLLRTLEGPDGRSVVWLIHRTVASLTFAIGTVIAAGNALRFDGSSSRTSASFAVAWFGAWLFYEWVGRRHRAPLLPALPHAIGTAVGLVTGAIGVVGTVDAALDHLIPTDAIRPGGFGPFADWVPWAVVGVAVWMWQRRGVDPDAPSMAAVDIALGIGGGALLGLGGVAALLFIVFDAIGEGFALEDVGGAGAAAVVGLAIWRLHDLRVATSDRRSQATHVVAGLALIGLASAIGVLVNVVLGQISPEFISPDSSVVAGGIAALAVSAPTWWMTWRPDRQPDEASGTNLRRVYLTLLAGVGAVVATIALVVVVFQVIQGFLDGDGFADVVDRSRAAVGVLVGTGLVTWYHLRLWRAGRPDEAEPSMLERVTFVGPRGVADDLRRTLDVRVTNWQSAGTGRLVDEAELADHLRSLGTTPALVVAEDGGYRITRIGVAPAQQPQTGEPQS